MTPTVRVITESDDKLKAIMLCDEVFTISVVSRDNFEELFSKIDKFATFLIAECDGECAGYTAIYCNDTVKKTSYITLICVREEFQRMHLGTFMINECEKISVHNGMERIKLEVLNVDEKAQRFYSKMGFVRIAEASENSIFMEKEIG